MNKDQVREQLSFHSGRNKNIDDPRWKKGFLGSLRPYQGMELIESNFHNIIECLYTLSPYLRESELIEKGIVSDVSGILCLAKAWAVHADGMLRSNNIITQNQANVIDGWLDCISYTWTMVLDSQDENIAFKSYNEQYISNIDTG